MTTTTQVITAPGIYLDVPHDVYIADPVEGGSLSHSGARKLLPPSCPAIFAYERTHPKAATESMEFGSYAHNIILGTGQEIVTVEADNWKPVWAQNARKEARARGAIALLPDGVATVHAMAAAILKHDTAAALLRPEGGTAEATLVWVDEATGVTCRSRLDMLPPKGRGRLILADYKTAASANRDKFAKAAVDYDYHTQGPFYLDGATALDLGDDCAFVFVVQEKTPPYLVNVIELDAEANRIGRRLNRQAIDTYAQCTATGEWPGYSDDVELVALPGWYAARFDERGWS